MIAYVDSEACVVDVYNNLARVLVPITILTKIDVSLPRHINSVKIIPVKAHINILNAVCLAIQDRQELVIDASSVCIQSYTRPTKDSKFFSTNLLLGDCPTVYAGIESIIRRRKRRKLSLPNIDQWTKVVAPTPVSGDGNFLRCWFTSLIGVMDSYRVSPVVASTYLCAVAGMEACTGLADRSDARLMYNNRQGLVVDSLGNPYAFVSNFFGSTHG